MKKTVLFGLMAAFIMINISLVSAINTIQKNSCEKEKESPLFKVRLQSSLKEKIQSFFTKIINDRLFVLQDHSSSDSNTAAWTSLPPTYMCDKRCRDSN